MQKFTIFTIIFSVVVVTITTELVIQDYLQKVYPPAETLQADSVEKNDFNVFYPDEDAVSRETEEKEEPSEDEVDETPENRTDRVKEILDRRRGDDEEPADEERGSAPIEIVRVKRLLPALTIEGVELKNVDYPGKMFNLVDTTDLNVEETGYGLFNTSEGTLGSVYEFRFKTELKAEEGYTIIQARVNAVDNIEANATNQFGEKSFYINNVVKVGEVFVVFQQDNYIYAFAYKKEYHEIFKAFFAVLS